MATSTESAITKTRKPKHCVPKVELSLDEGDVAEQVVSHLGTLGWGARGTDEAKRLYVRGEALVQVLVSDEPGKLGQLTIRPIHLSITRERITQACQLQTTTTRAGKPKVKPERPPNWLVNAIHNRGYYGGKIRPLLGVIHSPTIRPDGSILQDAGYDSSTGLLYVPNAKYPRIPDTPTHGGAASACKVLLDAVEDFPFQEDADRSAWLCLVLSLIGRCCVADGVPLFAVTANVRGAGKSLLVDAASVIAFGRAAARNSFSVKDEEQRKLITAIALEDIPSVLFDNLDIQLSGRAIDAALTAITWRDRLLSTNSTTGELPMRTVWSATGNNMTFGSDIARRVLCIRLYSTLEAPENRSGFKHDNLLAWTNKNRHELAVAALTILRAYFVAGTPVQPGSHWGSYQTWSDIIRGAVVWAGQADPLVTRITASENDESKGLLGLLINGIQEVDPSGTGVTTKDIERLVSHRPSECPLCPALQEAVSLICGDKFNAKRFAGRLRSFKERVHDGKFIKSEDGHGGVKRWSVGIASGGFASPLVGIGLVSESQTNQDKGGNLREEYANGWFGGFPFNAMREEKSINRIGEGGETNKPNPQTHHEVDLTKEPGVRFEQPT